MAQETISMSPTGITHREFIAWLESPDRDLAVVDPGHTRWYMTASEHPVTTGVHAPVIVCSHRLESDNPGLGNQNYGVFVRAYRNYECIAETFVSAKSVWEPETRNKIGDKGACRDIPNEPAIDEAIDDLLARVREI